MVCKDWDNLKKETLSRNKSITLSTFGKPSKNFFITGKTFKNIIIILFKSEYLCKISTSALCKAHQLFQHLNKCMYTLSKHNLKPLQSTNSNWSEQTVIPVQTKKDFLACVIHHDFHIPRVLCYVGGRYTGADRGVPRSLKNIYGKVPHTTNAEVVRILTVGSPAYLYGHSSTKKSLSTGATETTHQYFKTPQK